MRVFLFLVGVGILSSLTFPLFLFILDWAGIVSLEAPTLWLSVFYIFGSLLYMVGGVPTAWLIHLFNRRFTFSNPWVYYLVLAIEACTAGFLFSLLINSGSVDWYSYITLSLPASLWFLLLWVLLDGRTHRQFYTETA